ncbi:phosrestin-1-like [Eriocheir sinensis]|uniref:phosrestin-1-like n=1 Tax=Eriocheir sinensis TaxID=95602 RepID=UPI0021C755B5|nr:phosrestin-1-like [Eriocheir sinensis]
MVVKFQVFKKSARNDKITLYLTRRDHVDHVTHVDNIEGVLVLDPNYVHSRNVYVQVAVNFRFGREDDESLGYSFVKTMYLHTIQVYPPEKERPTTEIQRNLISKLGNFAFPFSLAFPELSSPSYSLMMGWQDQGSLMGLEYEAMGFVGSNEHDMQERSTARMIVRRLMDCPLSLFDKPPPQKNISRSFLTCTGSVSIEAKLNSQVFYPDENIMVKIELKNNTSREIKRLKVKLVQRSEVPMFQDRQARDRTICKVDDPLNLPPGALTNREFVLVPTVPSKPAHGEVFLQPSMKDEDEPCLAPSTLIAPSIKKRDLFGIYVSYMVRVKATLGTLVGDAILDIPFVLAVQQGS